MRTTVAELETDAEGGLGEVAAGHCFMTMGPVIAVQRQVKDAEEIAKMRWRRRWGCGLFEQMLGVIEPGMTETRVAAALEYVARMAGAEAMSFETIVASGERSALPHGRATNGEAATAGVCDAGLWRGAGWVLLAT